MKPLFPGNPNQRTHLDRERDRDKDRDKDRDRDKLIPLDSGAPMGGRRMTSGLSKDTKSSSSRADRVLFDISVLDVSFTPIEAEAGAEVEGGVALLVSALVKNSSL
jgi:hypothetical protein